MSSAGRKVNERELIRAGCKGRSESRKGGRLKQEMDEQQIRGESFHGGKRWKVDDVKRNEHIQFGGTSQVAGRNGGRPYSVLYCWICKCHFKELRVKHSCD